MNKKIFSITLGIVVLASLIIYLAWIPDGVAPTQSPVAFDPLNATYDIESEMVTLTNGVAEAPAAPDSVMTVKTQLFGEPAYGDLNGDGVNDAAVILVQNPGGSGTFYYVAVAVSTPQGARGTNAMLLGDRIAPQTLEVRDGAVIANYADRKPGEPMTAQPSLGISKYLTLQGTSLREIMTSNDNLQVFSPAPLQTITSPIAVAGKSNFFEANTRIRITDANGTVLADTFATADGAGDALYPFSQQVEYQKPGTARGVVEIFEQSAADGSDLHKLSIPVIFGDVDELSG